MKLYFQGRHRRTPNSRIKYCLRTVITSRFRQSVRRVPFCQLENHVLVSNCPRAPRQQHRHRPLRWRIVINEFLVLSESRAAPALPRNPHINYRRRLIIVMTGTVSKAKRKISLLLCVPIMATGNRLTCIHRNLICRCVKPREERRVEKWGKFVMWSLIPTGYID